MRPYGERHGDAWLEGDNVRVYRLKRVGHTKDTDRRPAAVMRRTLKRRARQAARLLCGILTALFVALLLAPSMASAATEAQLRKALVGAHRDVHGKAPNANRLAVAMAQVGLEVGRGAHVTCNNIGQIAAPLKDPHCYTKGGFRVRKYKSLRASAAAYWRLKAVRRALPAFDSGDVRGAALALKRGGYYTASFETYAARMMAVYREQNK